LGILDLRTRFSSVGIEYLASSIRESDFGTAVESFAKKLRLPFTPHLVAVFGPSVRRISLAEYILVLRVYSHLLQMTRSMTGAAKCVFFLLGMRTKSLSTVLLVFLDHLT
jgi:hypothetical protein